MECLKNEGVDTVFGIPGGANLPTYDALYDAGIGHILGRHEQGAGHAAEGYAKASGKVGVALATSGPGATNLVTAIADAVMDSVPTVSLPGQVRTELIGTDGFQEADVTGITMPIVKHSIMIQDPRDIPLAIHEAFHIARTGRPGPVLIDVPQDLSRADIKYEPVDSVELPGYQPTTEGNAKQIRLAAKALANSRRPVIYAGGGVVNADAAKELVDLVTSGKFPITCTVMGLGAFPAPHDQRLRMLGMHGTPTATYPMDHAELILAGRARQWINAGGLGTMGFGLPSALGAKAACPDQDVVCLAGDGSLQMTSQELATLVTEDIPVKVFIMNNGFLGMVRQWQELFWDKRYSAGDIGAGPDWVKLAEGYGAKGMLATEKESLVEQMKEAIAVPGPVVVDVRVTKEENCYPMIPAGQAARDMVG